MAPRVRPRRRPARGRELLVAASAAVACYAAYRALRARRSAAAYARLKGALRAAWATCAGFGEGARVLAALSLDVARFLESDEEEVPRSLAQACKLARSEAVQGAVNALAGACLRGALDAGRGGEGEGAAPSQVHSLVDLVLSKVLTERGERFVAAVCGRVARDCAEVWAEQQQGRRQAASGGGGAAADELSLKPLYEALVAWSDRPAATQMVAACAGEMAKSATEVYMTKASRHSEYADMLDAVSENPQRREVVVDMVGVACRVAAGAFREANRPYTPAPMRYAARSRPPSTTESDEDGSCTSGPPTPDKYDVVTPIRPSSRAAATVGTLVSGGGVGGGGGRMVRELAQLLPLLSKPEHRGLVRDVTCAAAGEVVRSATYGVSLRRSERHVATDPVGAMAARARQAASQALVAVTGGVALMLYAVSGTAL